MTEIICSRCHESFYSASPKDVRSCPYCGKDLFGPITEVAIDGKTVWTNREGRHEL